jgi:hypothetical protein
MQIHRLAIPLLLVAAACETPASSPVSAAPVGPLPPKVKCLLGPVMDPSNATLSPGDTLQVEFESGCVGPLGSFAWTSADTSVAVVAARAATLGWSAVITARRSGSAAITARSVNDAAVTGTTAVTVRGP